MKYGLIGAKLGHSFSAQLHQQLWQADYTLCPLPEEALPDFFRRRDFAGINVTIPYKKTVMPFLDRIDSRAERVGCVNTVIREKDGSLTGYNTDYDGFSMLAARTGIVFAGKKVLIFGSGATANTVRCVAEDGGCKEAVLVSRRGPVTYDRLDSHRDAEILVNATPLGMFPENGRMAADPADFPRCSGVLDVVYNPQKTALILRAEALSIPACGGLPMLVGQAAAAMPLFCNRVCSAAQYEKALLCLQRQTENLVLIGMPGCGKTTAGRLLAAALNRRLIDTDAQIAQQTGEQPGTLIEKRGEKAFRALEAEAIEAAGKQTGCVIAIGGGGILLPENRLALRQNGRIYFLDRPLALLDRKNRPLSAGTAALQALDKARRPLYEALADKIIPADQSAAEAVAAILADFTAGQEE